MSTDRKIWQELIEGIEQLMQEIADTERKEELRQSIRLFKSMMEHGEPWPGKRRKRKPKRPRNL
jgi:hypothetical protein